MRISILATGIELTPAIRSYVLRKLVGVARLVRRYEKDGEIEAAIEVSKTTQHHRHGEIFYAEATLPVPGSVMRAECKASDLYAAVDGMKDTLKTELVRRKGKSITGRHKIGK